MASKSKKRKTIKKWKKVPNKANLKADQKRIQNNLEILRDLASKDESYSPPPTLEPQTPQGTKNDSEE